VGVLVPVRVGVCVGVFVGVTVGVCVDVLVGVLVAVLVGVCVGVFVAVWVAVCVGLLVGVFVGVRVGVSDGVLVGVLVGVSVGVGVATGHHGKITCPFGSPFTESVRVRVESLPPLPAFANTRICKASVEAPVEEMPEKVKVFCPVVVSPPERPKIVAPQFESTRTS
jgi:hypothetical protein